MNILTYDIETDGFLDVVSKLHCINMSDGKGTTEQYFTPNGFRLALQRLRSADYIVAHNQLEYDLKVIEKLYPGFKRPPPNRIIDTLVLSRLAFPDRPKGHSLEAWANHFIAKGVVDVPPKYFIKDWSEQPLEDYLMRCDTDVQINLEVLKFLLPQIDLSAFGGEEIWRNYV